MKRLSLVTGFVGLAVLSAACSAADDSPSPFGETIASESLASRLTADLGAPVFAEQSGTHTFAMAHEPTRIVANDSAGASAWLESYKKDLGLSATTPLHTTGFGGDDSGLRHATFSVGPEGVPSPYQIDVMLDEDGRLAGLVADVPPHGAQLEAKIDPEAAKTSMNAYLARQPSFEAAQVTEHPSLQIRTADNGEPTLVYEASVVEGSPLTIAVSAENGAFVGIEGRVQLASATSTAVGGYAAPGSFATGILPTTLEVDFAPSADPTKVALKRIGQPGITEIATFMFTQFDSSYQPVQKEVASPDNSKFDSTGNYSTGEAKGSAVDAHHNIAAIDMDFRWTFGQGLGEPKASDSSGVEYLKVQVHQNDSFSGDPDHSLQLNAAYSAAANTIFIGDGGPGGSAYPGRVMLPPSAALDVMAHESAHILMSRRGLGRSLEAGVIQEGLADVLGKLYEHRVLKTSLTASPKVFGAWAFTDGRGFRDLARPSRLPGSWGTPAADSTESRAYACPARLMKNPKTGKNEVMMPDDGCVHARATVIGHAFYLMTFGGRNETSNVLVPTGIGWSLAADLWQGLLPKGTKFAPTSLRTIAEQQLTRILRLTPPRIEATGLVFPKEILSVACAWEAVGVLRADTVSAMTRGLSVCPKAPAESPCTGRPNGTYCDTERNWNAFRCTNGSASAIACANAKKCISTGPDYQDQALLGTSGELTCE